MIGHQEFDQRVAGGEHAFGCGLNFHPVFCRADAGGGVDARSDVDHADAADANRIFVLLVAECRDGDAIHARSIEDGGASGDGDRKAVNGERDVGGGFGGHGLETLFTTETRRGGETFWRYWYVRQKETFNHLGYEARQTKILNRKGREGSQRAIRKALTTEGTEGHGGLVFSLRDSRAAVIGSKSFGAIRTKAKALTTEGTEGHGGLVFSLRDNRVGVIGRKSFGAIRTKAKALTTEGTEGHGGCVFGGCEIFAVTAGCGFFGAR